MKVIFSRKGFDSTYGGFPSIILPEEMNYKISPEMDVKDYVKNVQEKYKDLYKFMDELIDIVIINDEIV